jgi:hypothetical protein
VLRTFALLYILTGLLFVGVAIPLVLGRVPPNPWYGFRVPQTLNNPSIWYPANAYSGRLLLTYGVLQTLFAAVLAIIPGISGQLYAILCTAFLVVGLLVVVVLSVSYVRTLSR